MVDNVEGKIIYDKLFSNFEKENKRTPTQEEMLKLFSKKLNIKPFTSKKDFIAFEKIRQSGYTNMLNFPEVKRLSDLNKLSLTLEKIEHISLIYNALNNTYPEVRKTKFLKTHFKHAGKKLGVF